MPHPPRHLLLLLTLCCLTAAELPDPTKDLSGRSLIANLAKLRTEVAERPKDPAVWAAVTRIYAMLALHTEPDMWGAYGPWWDYAHRARTTLDGLRPGEPTTLDEALPGLWVDVLDRDARQVITSLDRLAPSSTHPEALALRSLSLARPELAEGPGPLLGYARSAAGLLSGRTQFLNLKDKRGQDPWSIEMLRMYANTDFNRSGMLHAVMADTAWMLLSPDLDDATALPLLSAMVQAIDLEPTAGAERTALVQQFQTGIRSADPLGVAVRLFPAAWRASITCLDTKRGWSTDGPTGLVGLGDVARWNRDRQFLWLIQATGNQYRDEHVTELYDPLKAVMGAELPVGRLLINGVRSNGVDLADALTRELEQPADRRLSPALQAGALVLLASHNHERATALIGPVLEQLGTDDVRGLKHFVGACTQVGRSDLVAAQAFALAERMPMNRAAAKLWARVNPAVPMLALSATPAAVWQDAQVDVTAPLTAHGMPAEFAAVRWTGAITLPATGAYQLAVESDDGSQLVVAGRRLDNGGDHGMVLRSMTATGPATALPLRVEFYNRRGGLGCRLLWKGPSDADFTVVPTTALTADGQPGLRAELHLFADDAALNVALTPPENIPSTDLLAFDANALRDAAQRDRLAGRYLQAADGYARSATLRGTGNDATTERGYQIFCLLMAEPPATATAAALMLADDSWEIYEEMTPLMRRVAGTATMAAELNVLLNPATTKRTYVTGDTLLLRYEAAMGAGDLPRALAAAKAKAEAGGLDCGSRKEGILMHVLLARILTPTWRPATPLTKQVNFCCEDSRHALVAAWLSGDIEWQQAHDGVADPYRQRNLIFLRALYTMGDGDHETAKAQLTDCVPNIHTNSTYHHHARALLTWYAQQTPASLAALGQAKAKSASASPTAGDANNF